MNGEEMMRRIEELTKAVEVKDRRIKQLETEIERLKPPKRGRVEMSSTRLERLLKKVNKPK
jgi:predicted RNase H-like nuclease (RuvC/YqgF family)